MDTAQRSLGVKLRKTTGTPMLVGNIHTIGEFGPEADEIETTTLDSDGGYREYIPGFKDAGTVSLSGYIKNEANQEAMIALVEAQTIEHWEVEFPTGAKYFFYGYVQMWKEAESGIDNVRGFSGAIRITGPVTYAADGISA
jgi:predicted secreted protein